MSEMPALKKIAASARRLAAARRRRSPPRSAASTTPRNTTTASSSTPPTASPSASCWSATPFAGADSRRGRRAAAGPDAGHQAAAAADLHLRRAGRAAAPGLPRWCWCSTRPTTSAHRRSAPASSRASGPARPAAFNVFAIYCRNDQAMSQITAWTECQRPRRSAHGRAVPRAVPGAVQRRHGIAPANRRQHALKRERSTADLC